MLLNLYGQQNDRDATESIERGMRAAMAGALLRSLMFIRDNVDGATESAIERSMNLK